MRVFQQVDHAMFCKGVAECFQSMLVVRQSKEAEYKTLTTIRAPWKPDGINDESFVVGQRANTQKQVLTKTY